jgi:hypothetical protein
MGSPETRVAALAPTLGLAVGSTMAATRTGQIAPFARSDALPIVDVHGHLNWDMSAAQLIDRMNQSALWRMVLMPRTFNRLNSGGSGSDDPALRPHRRYGAASRIRECRRDVSSARTVKPRRTP